MEAIILKIAFVFIGLLGVAACIVVGGLIICLIVLLVNALKR